MVHCLIGDGKCTLLDFFDKPYIASYGTAFIWSGDLVFRFLVHLV